MNTNKTYRTNAMQAINEFWLEYFRPPTYREVRDLTGMKSTSTVSRVVSDLCEMGLIVTPGGGGKSRRPVPLWVKDAIQRAGEKQGNIIAEWDSKRGWIDRSETYG